MSNKNIALSVLKELYDKGDYTFSFDLLVKVVQIESDSQFDEEEEGRLPKIDLVITEYVRSRTEVR